MRYWKNIWKDTTKPKAIDMVLLISVMAFCIVSFIYGDIQVTVEHSFNFLDSIFSGKFFDFYQIAIENSTFGHPAVYDFPVYFLFALWNLPIYIINHIHPIAYLESFLCLTWAKSMLVFFMVMSAKVMYSIGIEFGISKDRCKWLSFFFLTSSLVVIPTIVVAQYDIISILFALLGIRAYLKKDTKMFLIWFLIGNTMKLFNVFIFIPLILLREKKLISVIWKSAIGFLGIAMCKILFLGNVAYQASTKVFSKDMLLRLRAVGIRWEYEDTIMPFFVIILMLVCIWSYAKKCDSVDEENRFAIYFSLIIYGAFFLFIPFNPYWMVLLSPYATIIIFLTPKHLKCNILLDTAIGFGLVWISMLFYYWVFGVNITRHMFLTKIIAPRAVPKFQSVSEIFKTYGLNNYTDFIIALLIAAFIAFIVLNYPRKKYIHQINEEKMERSIIWIRAAVPCAFILFLCICYFLPADNVLYDSTQGEIKQSQYNLLQKKGQSEEEIFFSSDVILKKIKIELAANKITWLDSSIVNMQILEKDSKTVLFETAKPANMFLENKAEFSCENLKLKKNKHYLLRLSAKNVEDNPLYLKYNEKNQLYRLSEGGVIVNGELSMKILGEKR